MIFNNCGKSLNSYSFRYGANNLENVKSYKYLGLIRGFIKVLNRRATEFDTLAKNWQGPEVLVP